MHQPRPQKAVSLQNIEAPANATNVQNQPYSNAFHQQMPIQMTSNGHPSSQPPQSTGTPLSHIPERAIHAAPFQPTAQTANGQYNGAPTAPAGPSAYYGAPGANYTAMQPTQQPYYYAAPNVPGAGGYVPAPAQQGPVPTAYNQGGVPPAAAAGAPQNMVAQEMNGMVYYVNAQPAVQPSYPAYQQPGPMQGGYMPSGMPNGMPPTDQYYYGHGPVYYNQ